MIQYDICLVNLDPTIGHEIQKTRPCVIISPDEMNQNISTIIIAPMTTQSRAYPTRIEVDFDGKRGWIVIDQIRTIDKKRVIKQLGHLKNETIHQIKSVISQMLVE